MAVVAVLLAIITVLAGVVALGDVVAGESGSGVKRLAAVHVACAATGVIFLLIAFVSLSRGSAWASFIALVVAGVVGLSTLAVTRRSGRSAAFAPAQPAPVPVPVVIVHGAAALLTIVLVFLTATTSGVIPR